MVTPLRNDFKYLNFINLKTKNIAQVCIKNYKILFKTFNSIFFAKIKLGHSQFLLKMLGALFVQYR